mmetsp:Transcript_12098/g.23111  ORF Transcript_12098/g.23111 Transcript_12098/m.23111 type:complete len:225 (-) Transcript_12098:1261-1935(-)
MLQDCAARGVDRRQRRDRVVNQVQRIGELLLHPFGGVVIELGIDLLILLRHHYIFPLRVIVHPNFSNRLCVDLHGVWYKRRGNLPRLQLRPVDIGEIRVIFELLDAVEAYPFSGVLDKDSFQQSDYLRVVLYYAIIYVYVALPVWFASVLFFTQGVGERAPLSRTLWGARALWPLAYNHLVQHHTERPEIRCLERVLFGHHFRGPVACCPSQVLAGHTLPEFDS